MNQQQFGGSIGGPIDRDRTFYFTNLEQRNLDQSGLVTIPDANVAVDQRAARGDRLSGRAGHDRRLSQSGDEHALPGQDRSPGRARGDQLSVRYSLYDVSSRNSRGAGGLSAPSASSALDNIDQTVAFSNIWTLSPRTVNETRAQFAHGDLQAPPTDPVGPAVSIAGVATFGTLSGSPDPARQHALSRSSTTCRTRPARTRCAPASTSSTTTTRSPTRDRFAAPTRSARSRTSWPASTTTPASPRRSARPSCRRPIRTSASTRRTSGRSIPSLTLNAGLRYDLQYLQTIRTDRNNLSPRVGFAWSPLRLAADDRPRQRRAVLRSRAAARARQRAAVGEQHERRREPAPEQHQPVAGAGRRAGVSRTSSPRPCRRSRCPT